MHIQAINSLCIWSHSNFEALQSICSKDKNYSCVPNNPKSTWT